MHRRFVPLALAVLGLLSGGCTSVAHRRLETLPAAPPAAGGASAAAPAPVAGRLLVWTASQTIVVDRPAAAADQAAALATSAGGYVDRHSAGDTRADLSLRVPAGDLTAILDRLAKLGQETHRYVHAEDVTEDYVDLEARLKNLAALRDRLRGLLDRASKVDDVLSIERELTRVQSELDSLEGRWKKLRGSIELATVDLTFERRRILGPLGWAFKGAGWIVRKLFVLR